ncbi:hypothetical protein J2W56_001017 [Nocardia kruczakiae]|uniref:Uncharacterized protein n=1 Tax=Nocardia kruczakiae TaxID=261477 RepID=A0ABU1XAG6_9NOCA|nr:hypothetical protein [Nocardia kruczakiae]MDR7167299.1 hypothetical protein [Nocardia kruczakiae]
MNVLTILSFSTFGDGLRDALEGRGTVPAGGNGGLAKMLRRKRVPGAGMF